MRKTALAAALAAALAYPTAQALTPEAKAERAAVSAAQAGYVVARDQAKKDYTATKTACMRLAVENRADCIEQAKALRNRAIGSARTDYNVAVAKAKTKGA